MRKTLFLLLLVSCASTPVVEQKTIPTQPVQLETQSNPQPFRFENPGGMWMPNQLASHEKLLKDIGFQIDPKELTDPKSKLLSSVVWLGGCSASFVSPDGLVITNHHCAIGALQYSSTASQNLLKDGYLAQTRADEKSNGPTARVLVTQAVTDVTSTVRAGLSAIQGDQARYKAVEAKQKELIANCEKDRPGIRCSVASFFDGAQYFQIEQLEIRDVRLAYAPASGVGNFGGEIDNWRWPRHSGDFAFFRAYVGKDGKPADYAPDNVPFHPSNYLKIATEPLHAGDPVLVAGYPGRTYQTKTKHEAEEAVQWFYPRRQKLCEEYIALLEDVSKTDKEAAVKATPILRGLNNTLTNTKGQLEGLIKGNLASEKAANEERLRMWMMANDQRKNEYGTVLNDLAKTFEERAKNREEDAFIREILQFSKLSGAAVNIVRMAEERSKPDAERHPEFQERNWKKLEGQLSALEKTYSSVVDKAVLKLALTRANRDKYPLGNLLLETSGVKPISNSINVNDAVDHLYKNTKLESADVRLSMFRTASLTDLKKSKDSMIKFALAVRPLQKAVDDRDEVLQGKTLLQKPIYMKALKEFLGKEIAPDANSTLRITYGTVRGYKPTVDAKMYFPFTLLSQVIEKNKNEEPFFAPVGLVNAVKNKEFGSYVDTSLGEVPVNFLADLHITGGNSGSATLNKKGELVGLVFDGNYEAMASDWLFQPEITRSIHVDIRYVLWVMDVVDKAGHLVAEMGLKTSSGGSK